MPPSVPANHRASFGEPSHFIMQLCPHLSLAISGFLLMADSPLHQSQAGKQVTVGAGRVGAVQSPLITHATFSDECRLSQFCRQSGHSGTPKNKAL